MQKRISALLLAMVIVIGSVLGGNTLKVKAASVAVSEEFAVELTMMLYNLLETVAISSGIKDGLDDYESGSSLYDAFITSVESMAEPPFYDTIITMPDGSKMTVKEAMDAVDSTLGSNALKLPTSETFAKYRVISGTGGNEPDPTPTPEPENTPTPDTGYTDPFRYIQDVLVTGALVSAMAGFFNDLYNGKVEGVAAEDYYTGLGFTGKLDQDADGNYILQGSTVRFEKRFNQTRYQTYSLNNAYPVACYMSFTKSDFDGDYYSGTFLSYDSKTNKFFYPRFFCPYTYVPSGSLKDNDNYYNTGTNQINTYNFNFPVFSTKAQAEAFLQNGDLSGLLNGEVYDFPELTKSVPTVMQPLTGYEFAPGRLRNVNQALADAATKVQPETGTDTAAATKTYTQTMTDTMTEVAPKPQVVPQPSTTPGTETGEGTEGEAYKRDLRLIFPFCIPFDFIHFIQALNADPVAPCFKIPIKMESIGIDMTLELDLAWMDPIMEIFRLGELGCFVIMLMAATKKMIGW